MPLHARQRILYIFDFGDQLRHVVRLEAIVSGGAQLDVACPRVVEMRGAPVAQYPSLAVIQANYDDDGASIGGAD